MLYGPQSASPTAGWRAYGNETTFIDWFLEAELMKNTKHTYHGAVYMYKARDRWQPCAAGSSVVAGLRRQGPIRVPSDCRSDLFRVIPSHSCDQFFVHV